MPTDEGLWRLAEHLAVADAGYESDLDELQRAGADASFRDEWEANPETDPDTDGKDHD
jgi:hypothetical protein